MITASLAEDIARTLGVVNDMNFNITRTNEVVVLLDLKIELDTANGVIGTIEWSDSEEEFVFLPRSK